MSLKLDIDLKELEGLNGMQKEMLEALMEDNFFVHEDAFFNIYVGKAATKLRSKKPKPYLLTTNDRRSGIHTIAINKKADIIEDDLNFGLQDMINNFKLWNKKKGGRIKI